MKIDIGKLLFSIYNSTGMMPLICDKAFIGRILQSKLYDDFEYALREMGCEEDSETYVTAMKALDYTFERLIEVYGNTLCYIRDEVVDLLENSEAD